MTGESALRPAPGGVDLDVQVIPRASRSRVVGLHGDRLKIQLAAPPVEGAANAALCELIAGLVGVPRSAVAVLRGATGKRKTLRLVGVDLEGARARLGLAPADAASDVDEAEVDEAPRAGGSSPTPRGDRRRRRRAATPGLGPRLAALVALAGAAACEGTSAMAIKVILPEDTSDLDRADNAAIRIEPDGVDRSYDVDGTDFAIDLEFEADSTQRTLTLYLARGQELLAWGRSAPFIAAPTDEALALFLGRPGRLSTYPGAIESPDPELLAARAFGRGAVLLTGDGGTYLLSERTFTVEAGADFTPDDPPAASDGALVPEIRGGVVRVAWEQGLRAWRFEPGVDAWEALALGGDAATIAGRPGAAHLVDADARALLLFGGGEASDIVELRLTPGDDDTHDVRVVDPPLDGPRRGAGAAWVTRSGGDEGEGVLLVGGDDGERPLAFFTATAGVADLPDAAPWTALACAQLEVGAAAGPEVALRVLCVGGLRGEAPSADGVLLRVAPVSAGSTVEAELLPDLLPAPLADPRLFGDDAALYVQGADGGANLWLRIDRDDLGIEAFESAAERARGGHSVPLGTGVTFLLGGVDPEGQPVDRWQVFTPALPLP